MRIWKRARSNDFIKLAFRSIMGFFPGGHVASEISSLTSDLKNDELLERISNRIDTLEKLSLTAKAFIYTNIDKYEFDGFNIISMVDNGTGNITLNFIKPLEEPYFVGVFRELCQF